LKRPRRKILALALVGAVAVAVGLVVFFGGDDEGTAAGGDLIAYACREPENEWFAVCVIGADGTGGRQLTHGIPTSEPVWSHDGRELAFTGHTEAGEYTKFDRNDIHVLDADGGEPRQLTHTAEGLSSAEPAWSPDGRRVAFVRGTPVQGAGATFGAIFVMNADGSGVRRLTRGPSIRIPRGRRTGARDTAEHGDPRRQRRWREVASGDPHGSGARKRACLVARRVADRVHLVEAAHVRRREVGDLRRRKRWIGRPPPDDVSQLRQLPGKRGVVAGRHDDRIHDLDEPRLHGA
jgi:dipeptidyl aminopeptidase/acylaminoacyl peptidase